jgi:ribonuclease D
LTTDRTTPPNVEAELEEVTTGDVPDVVLPDIELHDGIPEVIDTPRGLTRALAALESGVGPVAIDAERASGFRYGQRAYLVQVHRVDGGTWLIDPIALPDLSRLAAFLRPLEWIVHAASQDLPCLAEIGITCSRLFDTELAARLLGLPRVGLGPLVAAELHRHLTKGHGAADWSTRPLPESWRKYAALDVEVLPPLRERLMDALAEAGKATWAAEEFEHVRTMDLNPERVDPWRRTSGMHAVKDARGLAIVRELWQERDAIAAAHDIAPGRVLTDAAIVAAAREQPRTRADLIAMAGFSRGRAARFSSRWWSAVERARELPDNELPGAAARGDGPPPPRMWASRDAVAAGRLSRSKQLLARTSERLSVPVENLGTPDAIRRVLWSPPNPATPETVDDALRSHGLRPWQRGIITPDVVAAINAPALTEHADQE